jgi:hypothetical protein
VCVCVCAAFVTERVFASLANVLGNHAGLTPVPPELASYKLEDVEVRYVSERLSECVCVSG